MATQRGIDRDEVAVVFNDLRSDCMMPSIPPMSRVVQPQ
jgi:hypothetical protein